MSDVAESVVEAVEVEKPKRTLETYDFTAHSYDERIFTRHQRTGAHQLHQHRLCTYMEMTGIFTELYYQTRAESRSMDRMDHYGKIVKGIPTTVEELLMADMDSLLTAIRQPRGCKPVYVILYTNTREDKRWLDFLARCPYAFPVTECDSKMGPYTVTQWIIAKKDPRVK